jgi:hypothetical protein
MADLFSTAEKIQFVVSEDIFGAGLDVITTIPITNVTAAPIAFKVKVKKPERFSVRPTQDVLGAGETVTVQISIKASELAAIQAEINAAPSGTGFFDKFQLVASKDSWKSATYHAEKKLRCYFRDEAAGEPEEEAAAEAKAYGHVALQAEGYVGPNASMLGVFELQEDMVQERPTYKMPGKEMFLFYSSRDRWIVGRDTSEARCSWRTAKMSAAQTPGAITETWQTTLGVSTWGDVPAAKIVKHAAFEMVEAVSEDGGVGGQQEEEQQKEEEEAEEEEEEEEDDDEEGGEGAVAEAGADESKDAGPAAPPAPPGAVSLLCALLQQCSLQQHAAVLEENGYALGDVAGLTSDDLKDMGIAKHKDRKEMLKAFQVHADSAPAAAPPAAGELEKFIVPGEAIVVGSLADATAGIGSLLGVSDEQLAQYTLEGTAAIEREFMTNGTAEDKANFAKVRDGTFEDGKTLDAIMVHPHSTVAKLQRHHVMAVRLYTSSSFRQINSPMRMRPPTRPHLFAATTYFINEGIKKLRHVEAKTAGGTEPRTLWRGIHGLSLTEGFMMEGGTEFACMSTSSNEATAANFAKGGQNPMLFKYDTKNCADRGADVAFLSVYEHEAEVLFPPLTYLRFKHVAKEQVGGAEVLVVSVDTQIVGN